MEKKKLVEFSHCIYYRYFVVSVCKGTVIYA